MPRLDIDENRCKGCGLCTLACPKKLIVLSDKLNSLGYTPAFLNAVDNCTGCGLCAQMCPDVAIKLYRE